MRLFVFWLTIHGFLEDLHISDIVLALGELLCLEDIFPVFPDRNAAVFVPDFNLDRLLVGFAFGAVGMACTSFMRSWQDFDLINIVVLPMFLFSATFYPITTYPPALQVIVEITPLYQGVDLIRSLSVGYISPILLVHVVYLTVMGVFGLVVTSRRLDKLLLK